MSDGNKVLPRFVITPERVTICHPVVNDSDASLDRLSSRRLTQRERAQARMVAMLFVSAHGSVSFDGLCRTI